MKHPSANFLGVSAVVLVAIVSAIGLQARTRTAGHGYIQEYRELRCRGGAALHFAVVDEGRTNSSGEQMMYMRVDFQPAALPVDQFGSGLQEGQCSFTDRALRSDEPNQIVQELANFAQLKRQLHGDPVDNSPNAAERFPDAQNVPKYLADPRHYWSFFVRQTGPLPSGQFEAAGGNYWKPAFRKEKEVVIPRNSSPNKDRERAVKPPRL